MNKKVEEDYIQSLKKRIDEMENTPNPSDHHFMMVKQLRQELFRERALDFLKRNGLAIGIIIVLSIVWLARKLT